MRITIALCTLALMSCSKSSSSPADSSAPLSSTPSVQPIRLETIPGDVLTDVDNTPLSIVLDGQGFSVPQELAENVARAIKLRSYPDLNPIPFSVTGISSGSDNTNPKEISIVPTATLSKGWYLLSVDTIPAGVIPFSDTRAVFPQLGAAIGRFNVGSSPVLRVLELAYDNTLIVTFSEGILADPSQVATMVIAKTSDSVPCTFTSHSFPKPTTQIGFQCPSTAWSTKRLHFELSPGLKSPLGTPLGYLHASATSSGALVGYDKLVLDIDFSSVPEASHVRTLRPEVP
jgi:hypothetical protein